MSQIPEHLNAVIALTIHTKDNKLVAIVAPAGDTPEEQERKNQHDGIEVASINFGVFYSCGLIEKWQALLSELGSALASRAVEQITGEKPSEVQTIDASDELRKHLMKKHAERN